MVQGFGLDVRWGPSYDDEFDSIGCKLLVEPYYKPEIRA